MRAKTLKQGSVYSKNGYTVYYKGGYYYFSAFNNSDKFKTLREVKQKIKML